MINLYLFQMHLSKIVPSTNKRSKFVFTMASLFMVTALITANILPSSLVYAQQQQINGSNKNNPIKHIVVIMQENRSFDNYFGTYPGANGIPKNVCMPLDPDHPTNNNRDCVKPFLSTNPTSEDMPHSYQASVTAYNNGKMNGFMMAENEDPKTMSYYDNKTIPYYWNLAKHYVLADNFYSSVLSYSLPNHWYAVAGQAPTTSIFYGMHAGPRVNAARINNNNNQQLVQKAIITDDSNLPKNNTKLNHLSSDTNPNVQQY